MPEFRRLSSGEAERYFLRRGQMDLAEYEQFLSGLKIGDVAEVQPADGESERALKLRLTLAAKSQGKVLQDSKRATEGMIVFRVK